MRYGRRLALLLFATALGFVVVWARTFQLQVVERARWDAQADRKRRPASLIEARRGPIVDARGEVLAEDRPVVRLAFVAAEWETRARWRCLSCGHPQFRRAPEERRPAGTRASDAAPPTRCSCGARGAEAFARLSDEDVAPLEADLGVPPGSLAAEARRRVDELERRVDARVASMLAEGGLEASRRDLRWLVRQDHFSRPATVPALDVAGRAPVPLRDLSESAVRRLELDADGRYRGFRAVSGTERRYPRRSLLAQVIGFTTGVQSEDLEAGRLARDVTWATRVGRAGIERFYDAALRGTPGRSRLERDEDGDLVARVEEPARPGLEVRLALTVEACAEAQRALESVSTDVGYAARGPASGGFVAIDAETGEVLAWAETPVFDLDGDRTAAVRFQDGRDARALDEEGDRVATDAATPDAEVSRVARIAVEPGSAMKVITSIALLESGAPLLSGFACAGPSRNKKDKPGCHDHAGFGYLSLEEALCVSCNRYFFWAVTKADAAPLCREHFPAWASRLGVGRAPGLDFPGAARGWFRTDKEEGLGNLAMGQGACAATPIQLARAMAFVANGRHVPIPRLAVAVGGVERPVAGEEVAVSPATLARVREGMRQVVTRGGGTARRAFAEVGLPAGVEVAAKTGTAQISSLDFDPDRLHEGPWHHWLVGYAKSPAYSRTIAFAAVLYSRKEEAAGATVATGVARFLRWWFDAEAGR